MDSLQHRIILVVRKSRLEDLIARFNTVEQARFYVEHLGADFSDYEREHTTYHAAIVTAETTLSRFGSPHPPKPPVTYRVKSNFIISAVLVTAM